MQLTFGIIILFLACVGNTELWVMLANRVHSLPIRESRLRRLRQIHDIGILMYPIYIILIAGTGDYGLLGGGQFSELTTVAQLSILVPMAGVPCFVGGVIRWRLHKHLFRHTETHSQRHDFLALASSDDEREQILGCRTLASRLPFNEIYCLEVNHKRVQVGSQQPDRQRLRIAHFSDTHLFDCPGSGYHRQVIEQLCEMKPDCYMFTGDLMDSDEQRPLAIELFSQLRKVAPGYFILGNHDWHLDHDRLRREISETGWIDLSGRSELIEIQSRRLLAAGTEVPWMGAAPQVPVRDDEVARILLSHSPDQRNFAVAQDFDLMLCGHNHGGQVVLPMIGPVYSPSRYGVRYAGGLYRHRKMTMHVSRGTGAKDAIRWNCLPEITLLEVEV